MTNLPLERHIPIRSCVACGRKAPKRELVRIVRTRHRGIMVDVTGKNSGRGAYLCASPDCWQRGVDKGGLERGLHASIPTNAQKALSDYYKDSKWRQFPER